MGLPTALPDRVVPDPEAVAGWRTAADAHPRELRAEVGQALGLDQPVSANVPGSTDPAGYPRPAGVPLSSDD